MTSLLGLLAPLVGDEALDPSMISLLEGVDATVPQLTAASQPIGTSTAEPVWRSLRPLLPAPPADVPPFPDGLPVDGRRVGATGWEIGIALPAFDLSMPAVQPGEIQVQGGRSIARAVPGTAMLHVAAIRVVIRAPNGADPEVVADDIAISAVPDVIVLTGGFGLRVGELRVGAQGVEMPSSQLFLPPLPQLPTGPIAVPIALRRAGGAFVHTPPIDIPATPGFRGASVAVTIDRPDARSFADLAPTLVAISVPLDDASPDVPGIGPLTGSAVAGGPLALTIELSTADERVTLRGALSGHGDEHGVLRFGGGDATVTALLAIVAALGPYLADEEAGSAQLALLGAAAAGLVTAVDPAGAAVVLHALEIEASWDGAPPRAGDLRITVDYECTLPLSFAAGPLSVGTRPGGPYRVRHRDVALRIAPVPGLSWRGASSTVVSPGDWVVPDLLEDLLRIAGVRTRKGSLDIELDLRLALDLGIVKVDGSTVRVSIDNGTASVGPPDFTVGIDIPGTITGRGRLAFRPNGFEAALDVQLPALGAGGRAAVGVDGDMVMVAIRADLFVPIPLANSGLGLFAVGGVLAANARPALPAGDPIDAALAWSPWNAGAWVPGDQVWMGFLADIGTVPDLGFTLSGDAVIVIGVPDPSLRASLSAEVLSGLAGTLLGVLTVDAEQLVVAVRGEYEVPHLVKASVPAGGIFRFADLSDWSVRIGGDRTVERGEPVTASILPDLLGLEAWVFLMAFGDANTKVGDALSGGHGLELHGMSLAFGAGFDVEWSGGPFSFEAGGVLLAALTHRPSNGEGSWVLTGFAELHGSVDLGPVSIGASANLSAFIDPDAGVFYADAHACASVDLWFTEIEGCVHVEIGDKPVAPAPAPPTPVQRLALTDRVGNVVDDAAPTPGVTPPHVWPDVIPVIVFETWVGAPPGILGLGTVIGNNVPSGDGWVGTDELAYRFDLTEVRVFEIDGGDVEVGTAWPAAWQLPLTHDVFGAGEPPAQARSLALNVLDLHHWLQPAVMLPENAPGDPIGVLGRLCDPVPLPAPLWFPGGAATLPPADPLRIPAVEAMPGDPRAIDVFLIDEDEYPADAEAAAHAHLVGNSYRSPGIERLSETLDAGGHDVDAVCWLPLAYHSDTRAPTILRFDQPMHDAVVYLVMPEESMVRVRGDVSGVWTVMREAVGRWVLETWRSPGGPVADIFVDASSDQQVGLLGVAGVSDRAMIRWGAVEGSRAATHGALEAKASSVTTARRLMRRDRRHRVDVTVHWQSRGSMFSPGSGDLPSHFFFSTAAAGDRPPTAVHDGGALQPFSLFATQIFLTMFDQSVLADADLARYVAGFVPASATSHLFTRDPVEVQFLVDHLTELAAAYNSVLTVTARRTDAAPGTPPAAVVPTPLTPPRDDAPGLMVAAPFLTAGLTALDRGRLALAVAQDQQPGGCRLPRPGAAATPPLVLDPQAAYRVTLTVDVVGALLGSGAVIGEAIFTTSRYAAPPNLLDDLGFVAGAPTRTLAAFPLPPGAEMPAAAGGFDAALEGLGLGGYPPSPTGHSAGLWSSDGAGSWRFVGVLIECPEPLGRPGRLRVDALVVDGRPFDDVRWDASGSRVLALVAPAADAPAVVTMRVTDTPHGQPGRPLEVSALVGASPPPVSPP